MGECGLLASDDALGGAVVFGFEAHGEEVAGEAHGGADEGFAAAFLEVVGLGGVAGLDDEFAAVGLSGPQAVEPSAIEFGFVLADFAQERFPFYGWLGGHGAVPFGTLAAGAGQRSVSSVRPSAPESRGASVRKSSCRRTVA